MRESFFKFSRPIVKDVQYQISEEYTPNLKSKIDNKLFTNFARKGNDNIAIVELHIDLGKGDSENPPFLLSLTIVAEFQWQEDYKEDKIDRLLQQNAPALLLSYARPIISNITLNSIMPYDIPFIDFTKKSKE